jgi:hypothetical protein
VKIWPTDVSGSPYDRGRRHGTALGPLVRAHIAAWRGSLEQARLGDPAAYLEGMLRDTDFRTAIGAHAPDLLEEVDGIADGAAVTRDMAFALQLLDEEWAYRGRRRAETPSKLEKCSSFAVVLEDGPTWIGQNMDLGGYTDGWQALLRIGLAPDHPSTLVFTTAGVLGLMGVNAAGLAVCVNSLPQLPSAPEGVPVAFVVRRLLQCHDLAEAADIVLNIPHATNQHYVIAEPGAARSFEACADGVTEYHPPDPRRVLHTNHPLSVVQGAPEPAAHRENSLARLRSLEGRLSHGDIALAEAQGALSASDEPSNPVCRLRSPENSLIGFTTGSMICALRASPGQIDSWVSAGPPSIGGFSHHTLGGHSLHKERQGAR